MIFILSFFLLRYLTFVFWRKRYIVSLGFQFIAQSRTWVMVKSVTRHTFNEWFTSPVVLVKGLKPYFWKYFYHILVFMRFLADDINFPALTLFQKYFFVVVQIRKLGKTWATYTWHSREIGHFGVSQFSIWAGFFGTWG